MAAWNALCSLIDQTVDSPVIEIKAFVWKEEVWLHAFRLYLSHAQSARPKSSRQLLVTLTNALRKYEEENTAPYRQYALEQLAAGLRDFEDPYRAKACAQLLGHLLHKNVLPLQDVLTTTAAPSLVGNPPPQRESLKGILKLLFEWLGKADFGSTIAQLVAILLDKYEDTGSKSAEDEGETDTQPIWTEPLEAIAGSEVNLNDLRAHIFPVLFKRSFVQFVSFLQAQGLAGLEVLPSSDAKSSVPREHLLFAALQAGKDLGIVSESTGRTIDNDNKCIFIPTLVIGRLLVRSSRAARLAGLNLLVTCHAPTRPFSQQALGWIKRGFEVCAADVDADFRGDLFSAFQKLVDRMRGITAMLARTSTAAKGSPATGVPPAQSPARELSHHRQFLEWLPRFLARQLGPTASHQRHISGLKCLSILARSGMDDAVASTSWSRTALQATKWPIKVPVLTSDIRELLFDLVLDPFDDVRQTAASILGLYCTALHEEVKLKPQDFEVPLQRAEAAMLSTGRADQADGVAHIYALVSQSCYDAISDDLWSSRGGIVHHLVDQVQRMLEIARTSLAEAVRGYPLHGLLISLRYVLAHSGGLDSTSRDRMIEQVAAIWMVVKPILCNDAPEGYTPEDLEESSESTKETLSYCWRALKEASLLLSTLLNEHEPVKDTSGHDAILEKLGNLCFMQLAELRHRGAFSTVAQTWAACCLRCQSLRTADGASMLGEWYTKVLNMLRNNVTINTRRSAGLPALLCGILIADKSSKVLAQSFKDLEQIARQDVDAKSAEEGSLAQVHAMNCLKDVFKNARLGEQSEGYIATGLQLAADALRSDVWAIRNCGLMLFRALIDRLLGTDQLYFEDGISGQKYISVEQHPELLDVILGLLPQPTTHAEAASIRYEGVFPALQLLQHTRIPDTRLQEVKTAVQILIAGPSWHVRDKAARTLASLIVIRDAEEIMHEAQSLVDSAESENALHGAILTARYTLRRLTRNDEVTPHPTVTSFGSFDLLLWPWQLIPRCGRCPVTQAACIDLSRECTDVLSADGSIRSRMPDLEQYMLLLYPQDIESSRQPTGKYQKLLLSCLHDPTAAVLRQAVARWMAQMLPCNHFDDRDDAAALSDLILELGSKDEDAVIHFLRALKLSVLNASTTGLVQQLTNSILQSSLGVELLCEAQNVLTTLSNVASVSSIPVQQSWSSPECNQRFADGALQLQAVQLEQEASMNTEDLSKARSADIKSWSKDCIEAVQETGIHTREAAAEAIDRIRLLWTPMTTDEGLDTIFLHMCIATYDLLNDDDEDIRLLAARITCRILAATSNGDEQTEYEPIVSSQKLLGLCISRWPEGEDLAATAIWRGFNISEDSSPQPVAEQVAVLSKGDTALFAEEKQNLYIDDAREVRVWSRVAQKMSPKALSGKPMATLAAWVGAGLDALKTQAQTTVDGALGWSSKAEVFTLGLRVIYGAEVLLALVRRGSRIPLEPSSLRKGLYECLEAFDTAHVHPLWRWEVERVLAESVTHKLKILNQRAESFGLW